MLWSVISVNNFFLTQFGVWFCANYAKRTSKGSFVKWTARGALRFRDVCWQHSFPHFFATSDLTCLACCVMCRGWKAGALSAGQPLLRIKAGGSSVAGRKASATSRWASTHCSPIRPQTPFFSILQLPSTYPGAEEFTRWPSNGRSMPGHIKKSTGPDPVSRYFLKLLCFQTQLLWHTVSEVLPL